MNRDRGREQIDVRPLELAPTGLRFDAPHPPADLVVESDLTAEQPTARRVAAGGSRTSETAAAGRVDRGQRREPILVEPVTTTMHADIEAGPAEDDGWRRRFVDRRLDR